MTVKISTKMIVILIVKMSAKMNVKIIVILNAEMIIFWDNPLIYWEN